MFSLESLVFLISSLITTALIYYQAPKSALFIFLSILVAGLLIFFGKFPPSFLQQKEHRIHLLTALFLTSLFIQVLLIATGGFFSAFIIVLHLFTLAMSLVLNVRSSIFFLLISVAVLASMIFFDPQTVMLFKQDPWAFLLHGVSFLVVIPLAHMMVSTYHIKDAVTKVLSEHLKTKEQQDESIFRGIGEFVLILNPELKSVFANEALKKSLALENDEVINKKLFELIRLEAADGSEVTTQTLSIEQAIADRSAHIVHGFSFVSKQNTKKMPVIIQVRPIFEADGNKLKQIILVMTTDKTGILNDAVDIKLAAARRKVLAGELEKELSSSKGAHMHYMLLLEQINDVLFYEETENHTLTEHKMLVNVAEFTSHLVQTMKPLADTVGVTIDYKETQEALVRLSTQAGLADYSLYSYAKDKQLAGVDSAVLEEIIRRLLKLELLISIQTNKQVTIRSGYNDKGELVLVAAVISPLDIGFAAKDLFTQNYGSLQKHPALVFGSGLEGVMVEKLSKSLNYPLIIRFDQKSAYLTVTITLPVSII